MPQFGLWLAEENVVWRSRPQKNSQRCGSCLPFSQYSSETQDIWRVTKKCHQRCRFKFFEFNGRTTGPISVVPKANIPSIKVLISLSWLCWACHIFHIINTRSQSKSFILSSVTWKDYQVAWWTDLRMCSKLPSKIATLSTLKNSWISTAQSGGEFGL